MTKFVIVNVTAFKLDVTIPMLIVNKLPEYVHELTVIIKGAFEEQAGVPLIETPAGKVISYFELLCKLEPEDCYI